MKARGKREARRPW